jgi:signal transduction histidine kinase
MTARPHVDLRSRPQRPSPQCGRCGGLAAENMRLRAELEDQEAQLRAASARIAAAGDAERRRLERNLHDGAQQRLVGLAVLLRILAGRLAPDPESDRVLARAQEELATSLQELRDLAHGLHPALLTMWGLGPALESLAAVAPVSVSVEVEVDRRVDAAVETAAYYLVCEALANVGKHAHAASARVRVALTAERLRIEVSDDGCGGAGPGGGSGLCGLADRARALNGWLDIHSPPGGGTTIRAELPCSEVGHTIDL